MHITPHAHLAPDARATLGQALARDYRAGASIRDLADRYGVSFGRAYRLLDEAGVTRRPRGPRPKADPQT